MIRNVLLLTALLFLAACSFSPIYGDKGFQKNHLLHAIQVEPINSIAGAEFYRHMSDILPLYYDPKFLLKVRFNSASSPIAMQKNTEVLRQNISQLIEYELLDIKTHKIITSGRFRNTLSYNTTFSPYATHIESESALETLTRNTAEEIRNRLILYFHTIKDT